MNASFSQKLGMERCLSCGHRWIDYENARTACYFCSSSQISECVSLREIRDAISALRKEDKKYLDTHAKRTIILKQRYREIAELSLHRAQEIYSKVKELYTKGDLSDKVIDQLIVAFRLFSDLGVHKSGAACAYMAAMGYAQRGINREIRTVDDLNDLVAARQWFMRLGSKEWEAAVNLHIGQKAMSTISTEPELLQTMLQVSVWHFYKARDYYFEQNNAKMVDRLQFDIEHSTRLLTTYAQGRSGIESARIQAQAALQQGESVRKGLAQLGESMQSGFATVGTQLESLGTGINRAIQASSAALNANIARTMLTIASSSKFRGRSLDRRMSDVGQLISATAREAPEAYLSPVKELGTKFAATRSDITSEPPVAGLAGSVEQDIRKSEEGLRQVGEPSITLTGTLLDTLISKGLDKVNEQLQGVQQQDQPGPR